MPPSTTHLTFEQLKDGWPTYRQSIPVPHPFITPPWLEAWWNSFGQGYDLWLAAVSRGGELIGIAPLRTNSGVARFVGNADVCDYLDFCVTPGAEAEFFNAIIDDLKSAGVSRLELESLRPDSAALKFLIPQARAAGYAVELTDTDVTLEMPLPPTWEDYLAGLTTHQRHEIGRKGRRLTEAGALQFDIKPPDNLAAELGTLIDLLKISRADKATFMTPDMEVFFSRLGAAMHQAGLLRFGHLRLDGQAVASVMCFDYNETRYLYNSGYDPAYSNLSVGLLSKVYSIKDAIEGRMKQYDYLKGAEVYKYHLGGVELPVSRAVIELKK